ncbi:hypothetical protein F3Y22_tig00001644pilonHSYRG00533 [Hibiscus syriacus]|uniref:Uncharacterized protein n=1 Tax=Hibiscus syriacus TaxID=106335 RepID=A0A6A3D022_HIBSY|nr:flavanone 7-O-glucoside 2''-O-beta-L-rhamnosyltransferase-like [Hibiscus syriacus]KAE8733068.1 hypothetical protein F3Y22_tig00001644pilonHSYRG00533 [Hibiscus syriacus]
MIEARYTDHMSELIGKQVVPVGPLVQEPCNGDGDDVQLMEWLGKKEPGSVVLVSFGSELFISKEDMEEIAMGLQHSRVWFLWALRVQSGDAINESFSKIFEEIFEGEAKVPMRNDPPYNAKLVTEFGVGIKVPRENGKLKSEEIDRIINQVIVQQVGKELKIEAKELGQRLRMKGEEETNVAIDQILQLIKTPKTH